ncbi:MAG: HAMP domain-containing sensor histidine kinase [Polyangiaceae bacterium]
MRLGARWRSSLALRIYLVGLAQIAVVAVGFVAYARLTRPDFAKRQADEQALLGRLASVVSEPARIARELERAREDLELTITVTDPDGEVVATTVPDDAPACVRPWRRRGHDFHPPDGPPPPPDGPPPGGPFAGRGPRGPICHIALLPYPDGQVGRVEMRSLRPPAPPSPFGPPVIALVLVVVGISSLLLARSIVQPLGKLSGAARALGEGALDARTGVTRGDELGEVSRAFDDMADRVRDLLSAEKELVANVSHELRTPLSRIRVALDIAAEGDAETARESLADIAEDLDELEKLVNDLLTAARLDLGRHTRGIPALRSEPVAPSELCRRVADGFVALHPDRELDLQITDDLPTLQADPALLRRVLDNLLENAHKYSDASNASVALVALCDGDEVVFEVSDHGIGIAPEDQAAVFTPFFRADKSRTRRTGGHGLGLPLAKRIVEAHGGSIALDSEPGKGTRVTVRLPC